jgi:thioredoxin
LILTGTGAVPAGAAEARPTGVLQVTDGDFRSMVLDASKPVLVDFWARWCRYCPAVSRMVDKMSGAYRGRLVFARVDVVDNQGCARRFNIQYLPTLLLFQKGKVVKRWVGVVSRSDVEREVDRFLKNEDGDGDGRTSSLPPQSIKDKT